MRGALRGFVVVAALVAGLLIVPINPTHAANPLCGQNDLPETGLQGEVPRVDQVSGRAQIGRAHV